MIQELEKEREKSTKICQMKVTVKSSDNKKTEDVNLTVSSTSNRSYIASCIVS